jgi:hypothetical protein
MDIKMPVNFPESEFRAFGLAATHFFPPLMSTEALFDPQEKRRQFDYSWQAVRYRYRCCAECTDEFKTLLRNASESWLAGLGDEEMAYRLERCIYVFFMSGLSIFDSFAFCLYFVGHEIHPAHFPDIASPRNISRSATRKAFEAAFPQAKITELLVNLPHDAGFSAIYEVRNLVGHRISGRRSIRHSSIAHATGSGTHWHEETWHLPGGAIKLVFDEELLQLRMADITRLIAALASAAREFAESHQRAKAGP